MRASLSIIRNTGQIKEKRAAGCLKANASRFLGQLCNLSPLRPSSSRDTYT